MCWRIATCFQVNHSLSKGTVYFLWFFSGFSSRDQQRPEKPPKHDLPTGESPGSRFDAHILIMERHAARTWDIPWIHDARHPVTARIITFLEDTLIIRPVLSPVRWGERTRSLFQTYIKSLDFNILHNESVLKHIRI